MIIRAPRPTSAFYVLNRRISEDRRLSWAARGLLIFLLGKVDHWQVSVPALVAETQESGFASGRDVVHRLLRELIGAGYMRRRRHADGTMDYLVREPGTEFPDEGAEPQTEKPDMEKPDTDFPDVLVITDTAARTDTAASGALAPVVDLLGNHEQSKASGNDLQCPVDQIVAAYHELMPDNPRVKVLHDGRRKAIAARWREAARLTCKPFGYTTVEDGLRAWRKFFAVCAQSAFLTGKAQPKPGYKRFRADIDFLTSPQAFAKCIEGKYQQEAEGQQRESWAASFEGIESKAEELGIVPAPGESYFSLRDRCEAELRRLRQTRPSRASTGGGYEHVRHEFDATQREKAA
ncbi:hypothetical protein [Burkholderia ubonensis]|uniref:hypothetical protein n=1 Tax=Burkholderia ubonensis TaxID=101571 RepID=UPI00075FB37C|nr:hypothetical protein [Burkholderia ubonensis]KWO78481.1 hypothetical protein WM31_31980 [Burkholderia ubonensis]